MRNLPFLADLSDTQIAKIELSFVQEKFIFNQKVYKQGTFASKVFIVIDGEFDVLY